MKTLPEFLATKTAALSKFIKNQGMKILAVEARNHFRQGFNNEGFTDAVLEPWTEVKRRSADRMKKNKNGSTSKRQGRDQVRKILSDTATLRDSIDYKISGTSVEVGTDDDKGKAQAHNEGTTNAGRGNNVTIPKRQFIGPSKALDSKIINRYETEVNKILK